MKKILILQFRLPPTDNHEIDCILREMNLDKKDVVVHNIALLNKVPNLDPRDFRGVIWGASSDFNVTDWPEKLEKKIISLKPFLNECMEKEMPTLGICFGHQVLAYLLGGEVKRDAAQAEGGIIDVKILKNDPLFSGIPNLFSVASGHKDSVTSLPKAATLLGTSEKTNNSIFKIGSVYGIQQHPELQGKDLAWRMSLFPEYTMGRTIEEIAKEFKKMPYSGRILSNFAKICNTPKKNWYNHQDLISVG